MFERYTEKARRTIFFGRFEASQLGSPCIETEHLLLGLLREDRALNRRFLGTAAAYESIRKQIEDHAGMEKKPPISTSIDLPLTPECKSVLAYAAEEADGLSHRRIGCEHLFLGLLREEKSFAAQLLNERGVRISEVREELAKAEGGPVQTGSGQKQEGGPSLELGLDLVIQASNNKLPTLVGREPELEQVLRILGRFKRNNPVLLGEPGVGKKAIVEGLAQRIANNNMPSALPYSSLVAPDPTSLALAMVVLEVRDRGQYRELMNDLLQGSPQVLFFIDGLQQLTGSGVFDASLGIGHIVKPALSRGTIHCIGTATPNEYQRLLAIEPWVERCFEPVEVRELSEAEALQVLLGGKKRYETFHDITYTDEALQYAVFLSNRYIVNRHLPDKALDVMDEAGAWVKLKQTPPPEEIKECHKRLKFINNRMENAISNHELEKARFYTVELRKEQDALKLLHEKYKIDGPTNVVTRQIIEDVVSRRTGIDVNAIRKARLPGEPKA
ncbi:MAG TPA: Clp protease N-terminal domain-containing protein [Candidatus Angelobacter sp.]|jgi:ATP-dependent Clp protease ATP-binding subunit ClpC|nr:Clp protease N-terminal domain-containing protein [Candidatus Angelobacter sp.]